MLDLVLTPGGKLEPELTLVMLDWCRRSRISYCVVLLNGRSGNGITKLESYFDNESTAEMVFDEDKEIANNKALAAGLTMGFAGGIGGLAVILIGRIADIWGISSAVFVLFLLPILAGMIGFLFLKSRPTSHSQRIAAA